MRMGAIIKVKPFCGTMSPNMPYFVLLGANQAFAPIGRPHSVENGDLLFERKMTSTMMANTLDDIEISLEHIQASSTTCNAKMTAC